MNTKLNSTNALRGLLSGLLLLAAGTPVAQAAVILNGSFEQPVLPAGGTLNPAGGSTAITGWTILGVDGLLLQTTYSEPVGGMVRYNAQSGLNAFDITGSGNTGPTSGIQQTFSTVLGQQYELSFYVGRAQSNNGFAAYQQATTINLSINGGSPLSFTNNDASPSGFVGWKQFNTIFTAASTNTTIAFRNGTPLVTAYAGLDNVSISLVPEPSRALLLLGGLMGVVVRRRRR